jgi:hypothetical protein
MVYSIRTSFTNMMNDLVDIPQCIFIANVTMTGDFESIFPSS